MKQLTCHGLQSLLRKDCIVVPNGVMRLSEIGVAAKMVYGLLSRYSNGKNHAFPSVGTLATGLCCSGGTIRKALKELSRSGLIEIVREHRRPNKYYFLRHPAVLASMPTSD